MELRVNDYVRTKDGIIEKYSGTNDSEIENFTLNEIVKSSPNIIDLIEFGDYVNGGQVREIKKDYIRISGGEYNWQFLEKEEIKSIVTKEQFSCMEYKIGE